MHKAIVLLTKAGSRNQALENINKFMVPFEGKIWDWYAIGGRWNNHLAPGYEEWRQRVESILDFRDGFVSKQNVDDNQSRLQKVWEQMGMQGQNPYCNHYDLPDEGNVYDVMSLEDCYGPVKNFIRDEDEAEEEYQKSKERWKNKPEMIDYVNRKHQEYLTREFGWEINVFNIETDQAEILPSDPQGYWAVMVDIHN